MSSGLEMIGYDSKQATINLLLEKLAKQQRQLLMYEIQTHKKNRTGIDLLLDIEDDIQTHREHQSFLKYNNGAKDTKDERYYYRFLITKYRHGVNQNYTHQHHNETRLYLKPIPIDQFREWARLFDKPKEIKLIK